MMIRLVAGAVALAIYLLIYSILGMRAMLLSLTVGVATVLYRFWQSRT